MFWRIPLLSSAFATAVFHRCTRHTVNSVLMRSQNLSMVGSSRGIIAIPGEKWPMRTASTLGPVEPVSRQVWLSLSWTRGEFHCTFPSVIPGSC